MPHDPLRDHLDYFQELGVDGVHPGAVWRVRADARFGLAAIKGNALFPLSMYWKNGRVKVAIGVGKGKVQFDKREDIKKRESDRELKRVTMHRFKGK